MDKATVALAATEDNAAAIARLAKELKKKLGFRIVHGTVANNFSSLGNIASDGNVSVLVSVPANQQSKLYFNAELICLGMGTMFAAVPADVGELKVSPAVNNVFALIFGE